jgi:hypothetical protein
MVVINTDTPGIVKGIVYKYIAFLALSNFIKAIDILRGLPNHLITNCFWKGCWGPL